MSIYQIFVREGARWTWTKWTNEIDYSRAVEVCKQLKHYRTKIEYKKQTITRFVYGDLVFAAKEFREPEQLYRFATCQLFEHDGAIYMMVHRGKNAVIGYKIQKLERKVFARDMKVKRVHPSEFANA